MKRVLLISNSTCHGYGYLDHCEEALAAHFAGRSPILFVPFALADHEAYEAKARERFAAMGLELRSLHRAENPAQAVAEAGGVFIGGGNTFRLLKRLHELDVVTAIRERVADGLPYAGTSAGSNVACVSIRTTNDMPIVEPPTFDALDLVPFNINPHYLDPDPTSTHQGETREDRIREFLEENDRWVVGLREGAWLRVAGSTVTLEGIVGARLFGRGQEPREIASGESLDFLLS
ncbi:MAG: dipeptidase PepE [Acidobacteriota bacterium]